MSNTLKIDHPGSTRLTPDLAALRSLKALIKVAEGPDRELDARLWCTIGSAPFETLESAMSGAAVDPSHVLQGVTMARYLQYFPDSHAEACAMWRVPSLTASLDAAVALVERTLPGWSWGFSVESQKPGVGRTFHAYVSTLHPSSSIIGRWQGEAHYAVGMGFALIQALLSALIARAEADDAAQPAR